MANEVEIRVRAVDQTGGGTDAAAKNLTKVTGAAGATGQALARTERQASTLGGTLRRVGEVAAGVLLAEGLQAGAQKAVALIRQTVKATSDLGESINAVNKVFDASSARILAWGRDNANAFGLSQRAFNQMATPLGSMLKNQGLAMGDVSDHTIKLTKRAADMASVFNTDVSDALIAIQAGLRGEQDPLERYGVSLSAVAVEARAMADSHKASAAALTNEEKALARLNLIYEQTADTEGDFADTADEVANAQRKATATIEDAQAKVGTTFVPVMAAAAQASGELAQGLTNLPQPIVVATAAVVGLGAALLVLAPRFLATKAAIDKMLESDSRFQRNMGRTAMVVGKVGGALVGLQIAGAVLGTMLSNELNPQVEAAIGGLEELGKEGRLSGEASRLFGDDMETLGMALEDVAGSGFWQVNAAIDDFMFGLAGMGSSLDDSKARVEAFDTALAALVQKGQGEKAAEILAIAAEKAGLTVDELKAKLPQYTGAMESSARGTRSMAAAADLAAHNVGMLDEKFDALINKSFEMEEAEDKIADAIQRLRDQIKGQKEDNDKGAGSLDRNTQAGRDNAAAVRDLVRDYEDLIIKKKEAGESVDGLRKKLEDELSAMGLNREQIRGYLRELGLLADAINAIPPSKTVTVKVNTSGAKYLLSGASADLLGFAHGGVSGASRAADGGARGGMTWVGEQGPELVRLPYGSTVVPSGTSREMARSGGGGGRMVLDLLLNGRLIRELLIDDGTMRGKSTVDLAAAYP